MHTESVDRLFVITGGPGSGKSTLVAELAHSGIATMPEAGRSIIQDQVAIGGSALPWADRSAFAESMLSWELRSYRAAAEMSETVIFDRGIPDVAGYLRLCGLAVPDHVRRAAELYRYHRRVFLAPPWADIFTQDAERKQTFAEAQATCDAVSEVYRSIGYELIPLPLAPVRERVAFVAEMIGMRG
jgi:predicted ATPase